MNYKLFAKRVIGLIFFLVLLLGFAVNAESTVAITVSGTRMYNVAYEVVTQLNKLRASKGIERLEISDELMEAAMIRAEEQVLSFGHTRPDGSSCLSVAPGKVSGENCCMFSMDRDDLAASEAMESWTNSSGHYANMVNPSSKSIGVGCFKVNYLYYLVQLFSWDNGKHIITKENIITESTISTLLTDVVNNIRIGVPPTMTMGVGARKSILLYFDRAFELSYPSFSPIISWNGFTLKSSDPSIVSCDMKGNIIALKAGTAVLHYENIMYPSIIQGDVTITVQDANSRKVILNANGGSLSKTSQENVRTLALKYKGKYGNLPNPVRNGYIFKGWYTKKSGGSKITSSKKVMIAKNKSQTLYARWNKVSLKGGKITSAKVMKNGSAKLKWKSISGAKGYEFIYAADASFKIEPITSDIGNKKSVTLNRLIRGNTYYVKVRAYAKDSLGNRVYGPYSKTKVLKI